LGTVKALLDTSGYSGLMQGDPAILELLRQAYQVFVPALVLGELYGGFRRGSRTAENESLLKAFLAKPSVAVLDVTAETAQRYAEIDIHLWSKGRPIRRNDVWIAALAMEHGCVLITRDAHFRKIPLLLIRP
jgi:tRNA(fMet)-specific endonuclease VapC